MGQPYSDGLEAQFTTDYQNFYIYIHVFTAKASAGKEGPLFAAMRCNALSAEQPG
jgi:hypothetical protein